MMGLSVYRMAPGNVLFWGLLSTQNFEDVEAGALFSAFFFLARVEALSVFCHAVGIGCSLLDGLLAFRTIDAGLDELAAAAARISNFAAHGKLAALNHFGGNDQWGTGIFYNIACAAIGVGFDIFFYFYFIIPVGVITFLTGTGTGIRKQLTAKRAVF